MGFVEGGLYKHNGEEEGWVILGLGVRVESVDENGPAVILKAGERIEAYLVVGLDGKRMLLFRLYPSNIL